MKIENFENLAAAGKETAEAVVKSNTAAIKGWEQLSRESQAYVAKSVEKADAAFRRLLAVKTPAEFAEVQNRLIRESIEQAVVDTRKFSELSQSLFSAAFEPLNARFSAFRNLAKAA